MEDIVLIYFFFHQNIDESFYCVNRKQLEEGGVLLLCKRRLTFCPDHSDECSVCKEFALVFENLQDAYFFSPNKHKHQPVMWKVFFEHGNKLRKFGIEIAKTIESEDLLLNYGSYVKRKYIIDLINQSYINQEENCNSCFKSNSLFCKRSTELGKQLRDRGFNTRYSKQKSGL